MQRCSTNSYQQSWATIEDDKGIHTTETMEEQHGEPVLSVNALTKDCLHDMPCHSWFPHALNVLSGTDNRIILRS